MNETDHNTEHAIISYSLKLIEDKIRKMDGRLWAMVTLLIVNLAGVIGILISNIH